MGVEVGEKKGNVKLPARHNQKSKMKGGVPMGIYAYFKPDLPMPAPVLYPVGFP